MLANKVTDAMLSLMLLFTTAYALPTIERQSHHNLPDLNAVVGSSSRSPSPSSGSKGHLQEDSLDPSSMPLHDTSASISNHRASHWRNADTKKISLDAIRNNAALRRDQAFTRHQSLALAYKGRYLGTLDANEKAAIEKSRFYFRITAYKASKRGDYAFYRELKQLQNILPSSSLIWRPITETLSQALEAKKEKAEKARRYREKAKASMFMEKEFGVLRTSRSTRGRKKRVAIQANMDVLRHSSHEDMASGSGKL